MTVNIVLIFIFQIHDLYASALASAPIGHVTYGLLWVLIAGNLQGE